MTAAVKF